MHGNVEKIIGEFKRFVIKKYREYIVYMYLYGSFAEGRATRESDIDVAIRFYKDVQRGVRWRIIKDILRSVDGDIDVVDLEYAPLPLRMDVYSRGRLIYCRDKWILFLDQNRTLKLYDDYLHISRPYYEKMVRYLERRIAEKIQ